MREWEEGSKDHLITAPSTSTYQATAKPSLMAWLCQPGYYFRHGGINWMCSRVQSKRRGTEGVVVVVVGGAPTRSLDMKNIGLLMNESRLCHVGAPEWQENWRENKVEWRSRWGDNQTRKKPPTFYPRCCVCLKWRAKNTVNTQVAIKVTRCTSHIVNMWRAWWDKTATTMNAPPHWEVILIRVSPGVRKSPAVWQDGEWRLALSPECGSGRCRWTMIYAPAAAVADASQLGICYEAFTSDWANSRWEVLAHFRGLTDHAASLPFKVHWLNNWSSLTAAAALFTLYVRRYILLVVAFRKWQI